MGASLGSVAYSESCIEIVKSVPTSQPTPAPSPLDQCRQSEKTVSPCGNKLTGTQAKGCPSDAIDCTITSADACAQLCLVTAGCKSMMMRTNGCQLCGRDGSSTGDSLGSVAYSESCIETA